MIKTSEIIPMEPDTIAQAYAACYDTYQCHQLFCDRTGAHANQMAYDAMLSMTIKESMRYENAHAKRYRRFLIDCAGLIEYWYRNTPETQMYRSRNAPAVKRYEELLMAVESSRPGAMWARALYMLTTAALVLFCVACSSPTAPAPTPTPAPKQVTCTIVHHDPVCSTSYTKSGPVLVCTPAEDVQVCQ